MLILTYFLPQFNVHVMNDLAYQLNQFMPEKKQIDVTSVVMAPMPGVLKSVNVAAGDDVRL